jgi:hypothetical protein
MMNFVLNTFVRWCLASTIFFLILSLADPLGGAETELSDTEASLQPSPRAVLSKEVLDFGLVRQGEVVTLTVVLDNYGDADLVLEEVMVSNPALRVRLRRTIPSGGEAAIGLELNTTEFSGEIDAEAIILTNDKENRELHLTLRGQVQPPVEILPNPILALSAYRWKAAEAARSVTVINHEESPLEILGIEGEPSENWFDLELETVEEGRRYRLSLRLDPKGTAGRAEKTVTLQTNKGDLPILVVTFLKDRVYASEEEVGFGTIDRAQLAAEPELLEFLAKTFHLYRFGSDPFEIQIESTIPFLRVERLPVEGPGAVVDIPRQGPTSIFDLTVIPDLDDLKEGAFEGMILVSTNDPEFPVVEIKVSGSVK